MPESIRFSGPASLRQGLAGPLGCELRGSTADAPGLPALLRFAPQAAVTLPDTLQDAELCATGAAASAGLLLRAANLPQPVALRDAMLHRDATALAEAVIPPRAVRWRTRLFWRLVFLLMSFPAGRRLLLRRYQK